MSSSVNIRPGTSDDLPELVTLVETYWQFEKIPAFAPTRIESLLRHLISEPQLGTALVAESGGRLAGYLVAVTVFGLEHQGIMAEVDEFFVFPGKRSCGIGARLLAFAETSLKRQGCVRTQLQLGRGNAAARGFYRRHGYSERFGYEILDKALACPQEPS